MQELSPPLLSWEDVEGEVPGDGQLDGGMGTVKSWTGSRRTPGRKVDGPSSQVALVKVAAGSVLLTVRCYRECWTGSWSRPCETLGAKGEWGSWPEAVKAVCSWHGTWLRRKTRSTPGARRLVAR